MPTTMPAMVPIGVPPPLEGATVTVAHEAATVTGAPVTVADEDDCDVIIPDDAEDFVVAEAALILKERPLKPSLPSACETVK